ncbi:amidohydrolase [Nonomuraea sp. NN258]|uniref:amidohydrolase n=1 Tax=Nonomuraea antri TaxID=2730852 RepID=UPI001568B1E5|nr:amidohydrolase [Nonomuraea antri]NRQ37022.1 amidohydrolase [Nonomuraea antri]
MTRADLVIRGRLLTVDPSRPSARALAVRDGRIVAVGAAHEMPPGPVTDVGDACVMPGFVEAHGHFVGDAVVSCLVDIRPVTVPDAARVVALIRETVAGRGAAYFSGWDALLQKGLPEPTLAWLDEIAPHTPLTIMHNSGHIVYFNSVAARLAGIGAHTPDPPGGRFGRTPAGELDGTAYQQPAANLVLEPLLREVIPPAIVPALKAAAERANAAGVTMMSEMGLNPVYRLALDAARDLITLRLRLYEVSTPERRSAAVPGQGDDLIRQIGVKMWADGSPWVGNLAATFPYLDNAATRLLGVPGGRSEANYSAAELLEISRAYFAAGWQLACHANGDQAVELVLDAWERLLRDAGRPDHRLRLEHCSAMRPEQFARAHALGVTCSLFPDHVYYWGEVLADDLFGPEVADRWAPIAPALRSGMRVSLHNDSPVTPVEPLRNISVAATRISRRGRRFGEAIGVEQAIRAQTVDAAYQLFADDVTGSLEVGKYADLVVLGADPREVDPAAIADIPVIATYLQGRQVSQRA